MLQIKCPKCGKEPEKFFIHTVQTGKQTYKYVYLCHYSSDEKKMHRWFFGNAEDPEVISALQQLNIKGNPSVFHVSDISSFLDRVKDLLNINNIDPSGIADIKVVIYRKGV